METAMYNLLNRRSVRNFLPDMVPDDVIAEVVNAGLYAPSAMGQQSSVIVTVTNKSMRDKLSALNAKVMGKDEGFDPFYGAPVVLVVLAENGSKEPVLDGAAAIENLLLAAHSLSLGSCWINRAKEEFEMDEGKAILKELGAPEDLVGIGHVVLGYPDPEGEPPKAAPRKDGRVYWAR